MPYNQEVFSEYAVGRMNSQAKDYRDLADRVARIERLLMMMLDEFNGNEIYTLREVIEFIGGIPNWVKRK